MYADAEGLKMLMLVGSKGLCCLVQMMQPMMVLI
jgi:hypothetical protein